MNEYLLDNAWQQQRERLAGLESWFDPGTIRHMEALGVAPGWRCLEVGGGGGSIALWLSRRVGPEGHILATDLDTRFLDVLREPNLEIRHHNILTDPLPQQAFDLVHARFVVEHLADRMGALRHMASVLKPGGWLLVEETDSSSWVPAPGNDLTDNALFTRWTTAYASLLASTGADAYAGRRIYGELHTLGLTDINAEGRVFMVRGGSSTAEVWRLTAEQVSDRIIASSLLAETEMARVLALLSDSAFVWMEGLIMAAWGRAQ